MKYFLGLVALLSIPLGVLTFALAKTSVHEIEGLISVLIGVTAMSGAGIIEVIKGRDSTPGSTRDYPGDH